MRNISDLKKKILANLLIDYCSTLFSVVNLSGRGSEVKIIIMSDDEKDIRTFDKETIDRLNVPHRGSISSIQNSLKNSVLKLVKDERSLSLDPTQNHLDGFDPNKRRISSISSLGNWTGAVVVSEIPESTQRNGKWYNNFLFYILQCASGLTF